MGDIAGIENNMEYSGNRGNDIVVQEVSARDESNSMPGSFAEHSGADNLDAINPDVYVEDDYRS